MVRKPRGQRESWRREIQSASSEFAAARRERPKAAVLGVTRTIRQRLADLRAEAKTKAKTQTKLQTQATLTANASCKSSTTELCTCRRSQTTTHVPSLVQIAARKLWEDLECYTCYAEFWEHFPDVLKEVLLEEAVQLSKEYRCGCVKRRRAGVLTNECLGVLLHGSMQTLDLSFSTVTDAVVSILAPELNMVAGCGWEFASLDSSRLFEQKGLLSLSHLDVSFCEHLTGQFIMEAGRHLPCLKYLSIAGDFSDEPINFHFRDFLALEVLDLSSCVWLSSYSLENAGVLSSVDTTSLASLQTLVLKDCDYFLPRKASPRLLPLIWGFKFTVKKAITWDEQIVDKQECFVVSSPGSKRRIAVVI